MPDPTPAERMSQLWLIAQRVVLLAAVLFVVGMVWRSVAGEADWAAQAASRSLLFSAALALAGISFWVVYSVALRPLCVLLLLVGGALLIGWQLAHLAESLLGPGQPVGVRLLRAAAGWSAMAFLLAAGYLSLVEAAISSADSRNESAELRREVAQRTRAEEALQAARDELEERVQTRTAELQLANEELQREVAEHARTANSLQRSEARFRHITESTGEWIWEMDADGRFTYCSQALFNLLGYAPDEVIGLSCTRFLAPGEATPAPGPQDESSARVARWYLHRDGRPLLLQSAVAKVCDASGAAVGYHGATRDITIQHQLERQINQNRNMELVGQLASGVAHDFNNLVGVMRGCCDAARQTMDPGHPAQTSLDVLEEAAGQATDLTHSLLLLGSHRPMELQTVDLEAALDQTRRLLQHLLPEHVDLEIHVPESPVWVLADLTQLQQALLNLAVNARDAMPDGGRLKIQLTSLAAEQLRDPPPVPSQASTYARLEVADTGCGIPPEAQARIFDPFYTTKARGQGAGLGLAIVDSIIKNHGGWLRVRSALGQGTSFSLFLPGVDPPAGRETAARQPVIADVGVLMAPEHRLMRGIVATQLRALGHRVLVLGTIDELLRTLAHDPLAIRLVVVDSPHAKTLWEQWPTVRAHQEDLLVLVLTVGEEKPPGDARMQSLKLPFDAAVFARSVEEILGGDCHDDEDQRSAGGRSCSVAADAGVSPEPGA